MSGIADTKAEELVAQMEEDDTMSEGHGDNTNPECWRDDVIEAGFRAAVQMVTEASMEYDEEHGEMNDAMHPMDVVDDDNVTTVYATSRPWAVPMFVVELDEVPEYIDGYTQDTREIAARRKPGLTSDPNHVRIQIRGGR